MKTPVASPTADTTGAAAYLRGMLELTRVVRREPGLEQVLTAIARTVADTLGFVTVVVNLYRPDRDDYVVSTVIGSQDARRALLGTATSAKRWTRLLDSRFCRNGSYFIPAGEVDWADDTAAYVPELRPPPAAAAAYAWQAHDALFAPLDGSGGMRYGIISVDEPRSGLRPDDEQLAVLAAVGDHAGLAIEGAHRVAALQGALARQRALMVSSLDCVIAMDERGRVLEFNPAAEQTFGFASEEVVGRELADLIVPAEQREGHRQGLSNAAHGNEWSILGKRVETTAVHADGTRLPVELALTRVHVSDDMTSVIYAFVRDISERRRGEEQLTFMAYHDPLTGLANRTLAKQQLDHALSRARRYGGAAALMFLDLDDFKLVNDRLGHAIGDRLLASVGERLREALRESDVLARQGGDEFLVVFADLKGDPVRAAENVSTKLIETLSIPFVVSGHELRISASVGIAVFPEDGADTEALLRHADLAMYRAKAAGGGGQRASTRPSQAGGGSAGISGWLRRRAVRR
jgi:diguanylate cyclase (GGDEF)-like protein/PAS domain S-box-containing protein